MIRSYGMSHVGRVRSNNEDAYATRPELNLFVVADGMGGAQAGERASQLTVQTLVDQVSQAGDEAGLAALVRGVEKANSNVRWEASQHPELAGMGTTLVAVIVRRPKAFIVNVGDSRAYLQGRGGLEQVTTDHSWVNEVGKSLGLTDEQLKVHPYRNVLTKAVGAEDEAGALRHFGDAIDEDGAALLELADDVAVVDDLMEGVDGGLFPAEDFIEDVVGADDAGAEAAGGGEEEVSSGHGVIIDQRDAGPAWLSWGDGAGQGID